MGSCLSSGERSNNPRQQGENDQVQQRDQRSNPIHQHRHHHQLNDYDNNDDGDYLQSMARVGSRVYRHNPIISALEEHKASTYQHVHELVEQGIIEGFRGRNNDTSRDNTYLVPNTKNNTIANTATTTNGTLSSGKVGLTNLGNTCFMNCSLQCLSNTVPLTDYFLGYDFRSEINYDNFLGTNGTLVSAYAELIKHLWLGSNAIYRPTRFKSSIEQFAPQFMGNEQHDAHELLAFLLDGMHEDLNRVKRNRQNKNTSVFIQDNDCDGTNDEGDAIIAWSNYLQRNQSILVDLFQGQLRNTMTCRNRPSNGHSGANGYCGHVNVKFDPFMYLSLPISEECSTLDDCLNLFCEEEFLSGDERWFCPKCQQLVDATKKIDLFMLPPILIIHLKRFKFIPTQWTKIDQPVTFPVNDWDLSEFMKKKRGNSTTTNVMYPMYDLYAVLHHEGDVGYGHYTAHAKNRFDGEWYNFNDSQCHRRNVMNRKQDYESSSSAYCLFYNRVERVVSTSDDGGNAEKKTIIRRQSTSRPELWPHLQMMQREHAADWKSTRFG